jgi:hypothetical protein
MDDDYTVLRRLFLALLVRHPFTALLVLFSSLISTFNIALLNYFEIIKPTDLASFSAITVSTYEPAGASGI